MTSTSADLRAIIEGQRAYAALSPRRAPEPARRQLPAWWLAVLALAMLALAAFVLWPSESPRRVSLDRPGLEGLPAPLAASLPDDDDPRRRPHRWIAMARQPAEGTDLAPQPGSSRALR